MGMDAQAYLAYGYDLGTEEDWHVRSEMAIKAIEDIGDGSFSSGVEYILLKELIGFDKEERHIENFYKRLNEAEKKLEVELVTYSSYEYPGYILAVKPVHWAFDWTPIAVDIALDHQAQLKLDRALKVLGIVPTQEEPKWILAPFYG